MKQNWCFMISKRAVTKWAYLSQTCLDEGDEKPCAEREGAGERNHLPDCEKT